MFEAILTLLFAALLVVVIAVLATFGIVAWWFIVLLTCIAIVLTGFALIVGAIALFARPRHVYRPDCYAEPIGDYPKVPHGR